MNGHPYMVDSREKMSCSDSSPFSGTNGRTKERRNEGTKERTDALEEGHGHARRESRVPPLGVEHAGELAHGPPQLQALVAKQLHRLLVLPHVVPDRLARLVHDSIHPFIHSFMDSVRFGLIHDLKD